MFKKNILSIVFLGAFFVPHIAVAEISIFAEIATSKTIGLCDQSQWGLSIVACDVSSNGLRVGLAQSRSNGFEMQVGYYDLGEVTVESELREMVGSGQGNLLERTEMTGALSGFDLMFIPRFQFSKDFVGFIGFGFTRWTRDISASGENANLYPYVGVRRHRSESDFSGKFGAGIQYSEFYLSYYVIKSVAFGGRAHFIDADYGEHDVESFSLGYRHTF